MCDSFWGFLLYVCKANAIAEFLLPFRRHAEHTLYTQSFKVPSWNISYAKGHKKLKKKKPKMYLKQRRSWKMGMPTMPQAVAQMGRHSQLLLPVFRVDFHYKLRFLQ